MPDEQRMPPGSEDETAAADEGADDRGAPYAVENGGIVRLRPTNNGVVRETLTNFNARIVTEIERDDGAETTRVFELQITLDGRSRNITIPVAEFASMSWVLRELGAKAIVSPGFSIKDHVRAAIQGLSDDVASRTEFLHIGWRKVNGQMLYLHGGGAIGPAGPAEGITIDLSDSGLASYRFPAPATGVELITSIRASLNILNLAPRTITAPIFAAIWRAVFGVSNFSLHLVGPTGQGKTALAALAQQHFGAQMDADHLPGSWSSTDNALEGQAFAAKDALLVIDDFAPSSMKADNERQHQKMARVVRAQGNRSGRRRMRPDGSLRPPRPPRGLILSTGEDLPHGQSVHARMLVIEVEPNDIDFRRLTPCQKNATEGLFTAAMAAFLQWIASNFQGQHEKFKAWRDELRQIALADGEHRRTPWIVADLGAGLKLFLEFAVQNGAVTEDEGEQLWLGCWQALLETGVDQHVHQKEEDPAKRFPELICAAISSGRAHLANAENPNEHPHDPDTAGWRRGSGLYAAEWKAQGDRIGWVKDDDIFLDPQAAYAAANQLSLAQGSSLSVTAKTLWRRLRQAGLLASWEQARKRNTIRCGIGGRRRTVLHLKSATLYSQESGPCGPSGPEPSNLTGNGTVPWADKDAEYETAAQETGPRSATNEGLGPDGPIGPLNGEDGAEGYEEDL